MTKVKQKISKR